MSFPPRASPRGLLPPMPVQQKVSGGPLRGRVTWPCKCFGEDASPFCPAGLRSPETEVNSFLTNGPYPASPLSLEEVAMGFVRVANEAMCRPIRALTQVRPPLPLPVGGVGGPGGCGGH